MAASDPAEDPHDPVRAVAGQLHAPAIEGRAPRLVAEERRHRSLELVRVDALDPLRRLVGQRHLEPHLLTFLRVPPPRRSRYEDRPWEGETINPEDIALGPQEVAM